MATIKLFYTAEMEDGTIYDAVADQRDIQRFEIQPFYNPAASNTLARFLCWSALDRAKKLPKFQDWTAFNAQCVQVSDTPGAYDETDPKD